uniref:Uncharacterized protein n=1 Tax=Anopheles maculatus TaxID=74869 RepID=A0A182SAR3_9DIPT
VEKEKRLSRPPSIATPTLGSRSLPGTGTAANCTTAGGGDTNSIGSAESSSNRNSIITNGSTTSEEDSVPPPLPLKTRTDADYTNLPSGVKTQSAPAAATHTQQPSNASHYITFKPLLTTTGTTVVAVNASYDVVETRNHSVIVINTSSSNVTGCGSPPPPPGGAYDDRKRPPTPPPKPARNSKV